MSKIECPFCKIDQKQHWRVKEWKYGKNVKVQRFECGCGKTFNFYESTKKTWTIPKIQKK
jgi:hypothetical protein